MSFVVVGIQVRDREAVLLDQSLGDQRPVTGVDVALDAELISLQSTLNLLAAKIDENTDRLDRIERHLRR